MEESQESLTEKIEGAAPRRFGLALLTRILYIFGIVVVSLFIFFIFWEISNFMYNKYRQTDGKNPVQTGIDVYAKKKKIPPLATFDIGSLRFEISSGDSLSSKTLVHIQVVLAYEAPKKADDPADSSALLTKELTARKSQFQDIIRSVFMQQDYNEILDSQDIPRIKREILNRINRVLVNGNITDIYLGRWDIIPT